METGLRRVCNDVRIGKILIQTDPSTGEPQVSSMYHHDFDFFSDHCLCSSLVTLLQAARQYQGLSCDFDGKPTLKSLGKFRYFTEGYRMRPSELELLV